MKFFVAIIFVLLLLPGPVLAASEYDACMQEEKMLQAREKDRCSGFSYLFNPSGCFAAQKALTAFHNGKCREIISAGKPESAPAPPAPAPAPAPAVAKEGGNGPEQECEQLKAENARLKAEIDRLRAEIERLEKR